MDNLFWIDFVGFVLAVAFAVMQAKKVMSYSEGTERMQSWQLPFVRAPMPI